MYQTDSAVVTSDQWPCGLRFYVISAFAAMIWNLIPPFAACLNCVRHNACFHRGSRSFRLLRKGSFFLCWPAGSLTAIFGGMVALPLAIRQSQCGIGTSGTPIFFARSAFLCCARFCTHLFYHQGHEGGTKSMKFVPDMPILSPVLAGAGSVDPWISDGVS